MKAKREFLPVTPSNIHILHPTDPSLAGFLRVGHTGHHKLEALHAADRRGFGRLVFDTAHRLRDALGALLEVDGAAAPTSASPLFRGTRLGPGGMSVIQGGRP